MRWFLPLALTAVAAGLLVATHRLDSSAVSPYPIQQTLAWNSEVERLPVMQMAADGPAEIVDLPWEFSFRRGQTVDGILDELGFEPRDAQSLIDELRRHLDLRSLRPTDRYAALVSPESEINGFQITVRGKGVVTASRQPGGWRGRWRDFEKKIEVRSVEGRLQGSLESSVRTAGGRPVLAYVMADVLQWDLDFNRDLREEDEFQVLYEDVYLEGEHHAVGSILALVYRNGGRNLEAYRFEDDGRYYDGEGRPLRKMFLRSPLRFSRVTSGFSSRRFHPVLRSYRPHYGVDYGAPKGTPVRVTANGVVSFAGWSKGGGKVVKVRHPNDYLTAYLHLSRFAQGVRPGRRVVQGEVVGYVGSTGLATASHLDYRVQKAGRWINPMSLKSAPAEPVPAERMEAFLAARNALRERLDGRPWRERESEASFMRAASMEPADLLELADSGG